MLAALAVGTQCIAACAAADCSGPRKHSHCGHHSRQEKPATAVYVCAYLPAEQAAPMTDPASTVLYEPPAQASIIAASARNATAIVTDTGPPPIAESSSSLVLKI
jgi:hypothetical protein